MKVTATTYAELKSYVLAFKDDAFNVLFVVGSPGQSKSTVIKQALPRARVIRGGNLTPFQLYRELYYHKDKVFVLDDVHQIWRDASLVQLLKALCETEPVRTIQWTSAAKQLEKEDIPTEFATKSRVVIVLNDWDEISDHVQSLEDRGLMVMFRPPVDEVLDVGRKFVRDGEVIAFVEENRAYVGRLSLRDLDNAAKLKALGLPWREPLTESLGIKEIMLVKEIEGDGSLLNERSRVEAWNRRTAANGRPGRDRSSYYRYLRRMRELEEYARAWAPGKPRPKPRPRAAAPAKPRRAI